MLIGIFFHFNSVLEVWLWDVHINVFPCRNKNFSSLEKLVLLVFAYCISQDFRLMYEMQLKTDPKATME